MTNRAADFTHSLRQRVLPRIRYSLSSASALHLLLLVLIVMCALSLVGAWHFSGSARKLNDAALMQRQKLKAIGNLDQSSEQNQQGDSQADVVFKEDSEYSKDLSLLFKVARESSVNTGVIDFRVEAMLGDEYLVRTVEIRLNDDYPNIKKFISHFLDKVPNASLQEIRIERNDAQSLQATTLLKLAFVYRKAQRLAK